MDYVLKEELKDLGFEGEIVFEVPTVVERLKIAKMAVEKTGEVDQALIAVEEAIKKIKSVNVKHIKREKTFSSIDELTCYKEGTAVLYTVGHYVMNGIPLGN
jgi:TATA-binding protein-associated factor Taf7